MLATVLVVWCVGSFLMAPAIGRLIRSNLATPTLVSEAVYEQESRVIVPAEVA